MIITPIRLLPSVALLSLGIAATSHAQGYASSVVIKGLASPTGILVEPNGDLVFSEIPELGKFSTKNMVSRLVKSTGKVTMLANNEPAPVNIARTSGGDLYWCCVTAGVIVRRLASSTSAGVFKSGLSSPNGIAIDSKGTIYFTQIPTPGTGGTNSKNTVSMLSGTSVTDISKGEPEPFDITVDGSGNLYWTCRSAGVLLRRDAKTTAVSKVLTGLRKPQGLAMDASGVLYFSEVPTPGKDASKGGSNAVWSYDPASRNLCLVDYGDPEPTDVAVSADGKTVYWTCRSAGVIKRADRGSRMGMVTSTSSTKIGDTVKLTFSAPTDGMASYVAASSAEVGPLPIDTRYVALAADPVFSATFLVSGGAAMGYMGKLDAKGVATGSIAIPKNLPILKGVTIYTAFVTLDNKAPSGIGTISCDLRFVIE